MKKIYTIVCLFLASFAISISQAQVIPDSSFETWTSGSYSEPKGWGTLNWLSSLGYPQSVTRTTSNHSGNYAVRLETQKTSFGDTLPGFCFTGSWPAFSAPEFGFAFKGRPIKLKGYYKFNSPVGDSCSILFYSTKWDTSLKSSNTIGQCSFTGNKNVSSYTYFEVPIDYFSSQNPDTAAVLILASASGTSRTQPGVPGSVLYVDDLEFEYATGQSVPLFNDHSIAIFPNPFTGQLHIVLPGLTGADITLYNMQGSVMDHQHISADQFQLSTENYPAGIYFLQVQSGNETVTRKIVKY